MDASLMPMLCGTVDEVPLGDRWAMEPKIDGWRTIMYVTPERAVRVFGGRNGNEYTGQVAYIEDLLELNMPPDTVFDGELIAPDGWGGVQGVMTASTAGRRAQVQLTYVVFDLLRIAGTDARTNPWEQRREALEATQVGTLAQIQLSPVVEPSQAVADALIAQGYEGVVCKRRDSRYVNSRSNSWVKYKPQATAEARIVGFKAGKAGGKFDGMVGAFEVEMLDSGAKTTVKCGVDANHESATREPGRWEGQIIEIAHHGIGATGVPRHPQFVRRRDDMTAAPARKRTAPAREAPARTGGPSGRNYGAMGNAKLAAAIKSLEDGEGEAYERCVAKNADPAADLQVAYAAARAKGMGGIPA